MRTNFSRQLTVTSIKLCNSIRRMLNRANRSELTRDTLAGLSSTVFQLGWNNNSKPYNYTAPAFKLPANPQLFNKTNVTNTRDLVRFTLKP